MSTTQNFFVLPLIAAAALIAPASSSFAEPYTSAAEVKETQPQQTARAIPYQAKATHPRKAKRKHHHRHHRHHHARKAHHRGDARCCVSVPVVPVIAVRPLCPPDFADAWYEQAKLAWVGPTRCYPFQPNGFYPGPRFHSLPVLPPGAYDDVEVVGDGGGK